jgi:hypothetical protein
MQGRETMIRFASVAVMACLLLLAFSSAYAHAPGQVDLEFDLDEQLLKVSVQHQVKDAAKHHVSQVIVELNGKKIIEQTLESQESLEGQKLIYRITDAGAGDTIAVTAGCNISGKKKASIKVAPPPPPVEDKE